MQIESTICQSKRKQQQHQTATVYNDQKSQASSSRSVFNCFKTATNNITKMSRTGFADTKYVLQVRAKRSLRSFKPCAVLCKSSYEATSSRLFDISLMPNRTFAWLILLAFFIHYLPHVTSLSNQSKNGYLSVIEKSPLFNVHSQVQKRSDVVISDNQHNSIVNSSLLSLNKRNNIISNDSNNNNNNNNNNYLLSSPRTNQFSYHLSQQPHRARLRYDNQQDRSDQQMVVFAFTATLNNAGQQSLILADRFNEISLDGNDVLKLNCLARLFGIGDDLEVEWWKDGHFIPNSNGTLIISNANSDEHLGTYRCVAEVATFSTDLFSSYFINRIKRSSDMPSGKVLSNAIIIKHAESAMFITHPQSVTSPEHTSLRLECAINSGIRPPRHTLKWYQNGTAIDVLKLSDRFRIYTVSGSSLLHIVDAYRNDSGQYHCEYDSNLRSNTANVTVVVSGRNTAEESIEESDDKFLLVRRLPHETVVNIGESIVIECLFYHPSVVISWTAINEYGQTIRIKDDSPISNTSKTAIKIMNASEDMSGTYTCYGAFDGSIRRFSTILTVRVPPLLLMQYLVSRMTKTQGTTTRLQCAAVNEPEDASFDISWYKDGTKIVPFGRVKLLPDEGYSSQIVEDEVGVTSVEFSKDLLISSVQQSNQGLYQCIVKNSIGEKTAVVGLNVDADFDSRITDLTITTDHQNAQFDLEWKLPMNVDFVQAQSSIFLLNYYLANGGSANNVPLRNVHCTADNRCRAKCCSSNFAFLPRHNYTFQMSTLLTIDKVAKISPLSDAVSVVSWDGAAKKALDLYISSPKENTILIRWNHPPENISNGIVQSYSIDYYKVASVGGNDETSRHLRTASLDVTSNEFTVNAVQPGETYRFRVIPVTRFGFPSNMMLKSNANFTFIAYTAESVSSALKPSLDAPVLDIKQNNESSLEIMWSNSSDDKMLENDEGNQATILLKYAKASGGLLREKAVEVPYRNYRLTLNDRFDGGYAYQFCGRLYVGAEYGADYCRIFRMSPKSLNDIFGDITSRTQLPKPVRCENDDKGESDCYCEPSREFGDAMRVIWKWPSDDYSADEFVVHYTLDENNIEEDDRMVITDEFFADLPSLKSSTTYRVMIEARNKAGGVEGLWFNCTTPTLMQIPAPSDVTYTKLNETTLEVKWKAVVANRQWSTPVGYVVQVQTASAPTSNIFVDGINTLRYLLTVRPNLLYTVRVAARSSNGELGHRSPPYLLTTSRHSGSSRGGVDEGSRRRVFWSRSNREAFLIGVVVLVGLLTLCFAAVCAHFRLKRRKLQMSLSSAGIHSIRSTTNFPSSTLRSYEMEGLLRARASECGGVGNNNNRIIRNNLNGICNNSNSNNNNGGGRCVMINATNNINHSTNNIDHENNALSDNIVTINNANSNDANTVQESQLLFDSARSSLTECNISTSLLIDNAINLDTKGGELGALPSGRDKFEKVLNDEKLLKRLREAGLTSTFTPRQLTRIKENSLSNTSNNNRNRNKTERMALFREKERKSTKNHLNDAKKSTRNASCSQIQTNKESSSQTRQQALNRQSAISSCSSSYPAHGQQQHQSRTSTMYSGSGGSTGQGTIASRSSTESGTGDSFTVVPSCILSRLVDLQWPMSGAYTNTIQPYPHGAQLASCSRHVSKSSRSPAFVRSNSFHLDDLREERYSGNSNSHYHRGDINNGNTNNNTDANCNQTTPIASSYTIQSPYNTTSLQSLVPYEERNGNTTLLLCDHELSNNGCEKSPPREIITLQHYYHSTNNNTNNAASSSMPNLTDSGIVFDEQQHHPINSHLIT